MWIDLHLWPLTTRLCAARPPCSSAGESSIPSSITPPSSSCPSALRWGVTFLVTFSQANLLSLLCDLLLPLVFPLECYFKCASIINWIIYCVMSVSPTKMCAPGILRTTSTSPSLCNLEALLPVKKLMRGFTSKWRLVRKLLSSISWVQGHPSCVEFLFKSRGMVPGLWIGILRI